MPEAVKIRSEVLTPREKNIEVYKHITRAQREIYRLVKTINLKTVNGIESLFGRILNPDLLTPDNIRWMMNLGCVLNLLRT